MFVCTCVCVLRKFKIYTLNKFQAHNTVLLTTVTMLCIGRDDDVDSDIHDDSRDGGGW